MGHPVVIPRRSFLSLGGTMSPSRAISRRKFLQSAALASAASLIPGLRNSGRALTNRFTSSDSIQSGPLEEFGYGDVTLHSVLHEQQLRQTHALLMGLSEDSLLKPFRQMVGQPAPGDGFGRLVSVRRRIIRIIFLKSGLPRDARSGSGFLRWRGRMPSTDRRRRARRCCG